jgi:methyltransferase (TIGR00027 family)
VTPDKPGSGPLIRNVSDTARWVAAYRARETRRPDALFRDPLAERLAGERGEAIAANVQLASRGDWPLIARTLLFDAFINDEVARGADLVVNLAAGLDTRPYRMALPASLRWVEVDLPGILDYKEEMLAGERPVCALERVRLDLTDAAARRRLFSRLAGGSKRALVVSEGLLIYLEPSDVGGLARDLAEAGPSFGRWVTDLASPGLRRMMARSAGAHITQTNAPFKFAPPEGPAFFEPHGWRAVAIRSYLKEAARIRRVPLILRLLAKLPESNGRQGGRPWAACCLLERV